MGDPVAFDALPVPHTKTRTCIGCTSCTLAKASNTRFRREAPRSEAEKYLQRLCRPKQQSPQLVVWKASYLEENEPHSGARNPAKVSLTGAFL